MNILFITESYYPFKGGVPVVVKYLAEGLAARNYDVTVVTGISCNSELQRQEIINGVTIVRFKIWRNVAKFLRGEMESIQEYVMGGDFDTVIVECGQAATTDAILPVLKNIKGRKIFHSHGLSGLLPSKWFRKEVDFKHTLGHTYNKIRMKYYYGYWFKKYVKYFDASICLTKVDSGYDYVCKYIQPVFILGNAAENMFFEPSAEKYDKPWGKRPYILSIANYIPLKGQIDMVREYYKCTHPDYALVMIGSQENDYYRLVMAESERLAEELGRRPVYMLTGVDRKFFPDILDGASLYIVASAIEVFSISLVEAMSRGIPFVSTNVGNARLLPGGVITDNINDFHNVFDELLESEGKRKELGKEGKDYAFSKCRVAIVVENLESIITGI